jgi:hypothetical protein
VSVFANDIRDVATNDEKRRARLERLTKELQTHLTGKRRGAIERKLIELGKGPARASEKETHHGTREDEAEEREARITEVIRHVQRHQAKTTRLTPRDGRSEKASRRR